MPDFIHHILQTFSSEIECRNLKKGTCLIEIGAVEKYVYFIRSGAVRAFFVDGENEHTIRLGYEGNIITSVHSFLSGSPSEMAIETLRASEVLFIPKKVYQQFVNASAENKASYTQLLEVLIQQQIEREIDILTSSPAERLGRVLQRSPALFQHVPLKYIAAYLRMTPETLSRIRKS